MVVGKGWAPEIVSLVVVVVVVGETFCVVVVIVMGMGMMICILMTLDLGQLPKAMSNRVQNLHLSGVLLPY